MDAEKILTTHVGSLVRPDPVVDYVRAIEQGIAVDEKAFEECLTHHIGEVVKRQADTGIDIVSDGEYDKFRGWNWYIMDRLVGFEERNIKAATGGGADAKKFKEFYEEYFPKQNISPRGIITAVDQIQYTGHETIKRTAERLAKSVKHNDVTSGFLPVVAPASAVPFHDKGIYANDEEFLFALADALHEEYSIIIDAGLMVQVDDAFLPYMWDVAFSDKGLKEYKKWAELRIDALNHALKGLPVEKLRYHICWGSFNTPHTTDIPVRDIIDLILKVNVGAYCIEMGNPRHEHEWQIWKDIKLPQGKTLIPGVISHSTNVVEHPELVAERLLRLANLIGRENIMGGTDCGFAQGPFVRRVHPSIQWAKLESLVEGARIASEALW